MRVGVIVNKGKLLGDGHRPDELRPVLAELGYPDVTWCEVSKSKKAPRALLRMAAGGVDRVLVWGGDGTVRRCVHTLVSEGIEGVTIGILPAGTANVLAGGLGIPTEIREAARIAVAGPGRPFDVGVMNGEHFAVMAGIGFSARLIDASDQHDLKERHGRLGYVLAGLRSTDVTPRQVEIEVDGHRWYRGRATAVFVTNTGDMMGGLRAFPHASPNDGRLDIGVARAGSAWQWLRLLGRAVVGQAPRSSLADTTTGVRFTVTVRPPIEWEVDGGSRRPAERFEAHCIPAAVHLAAAEPLS